MHAYIADTLAQRRGLETLGPEMLACKNCHVIGKEPFPRCARCKATTYCSTACQKADWKQHKRSCTGRVEAAKLTLHKLEQLDLLASLRTHGTKELSHKDHPGAFPGEQEAQGEGTDLIGYGPEAAAKRNEFCRQDSQRRRAERAERKQAAVHTGD